MLFSLSQVLSTPNFEEDYCLELDMDSVSFMGSDYEIAKKEPVRFHAANIGKNCIHLKGETTLTLNLECARCLETVPMDFTVAFDKEYNRSDETDEWNEEAFISGNDLDFDEYIYEELVMQIPLQVLCKDDCKGICPKCGKNLNKGACGCDTFVPDPRMAGLQAIFDQMKIDE